MKWSFVWLKGVPSDPGVIDFYRISKNVTAYRVEETGTLSEKQRNGFVAARSKRDISSRKTPSQLLSILCLPVNGRVFQ